MKSMQDAPGCYTEVPAMIRARRAPKLAFLSIGATISGLTSTILEQIKTGQPPLERHAYAWTGVPQSFKDWAICVTDKKKPWPSRKPVSRDCHRSLTG